MCIPRDTMHRGPHTSRAITVRLFIFPESNFNFSLFKGIETMYKCSIIRTLWLDFVIFSPKISPQIPKRILTRLLMPEYNYTNHTDLFALFARMVNKLFVIFIIM